MNEQGFCSRRTTPMKSLIRRALEACILWRWPIGTPYGGPRWLAVWCWGEPEEHSCDQCWGDLEEDFYEWGKEPPTATCADCGARYVIEIDAEHGGDHWSSHWIRGKLTK